MRVNIEGFVHENNALCSQTGELVRSTVVTFRCEDEVVMLQAPSVKYRTIVGGKHYSPSQSIRCRNAHFEPYVRLLCSSAPNQAGTPLSRALGTIARAWICNTNPLWSMNAPSHYARALPGLSCVGMYGQKEKDPQ